MTIQSVEPHATRLLSYVMASADMYYCEMEQRDVFLSCNEQEKLSIWGRTRDGQPSTAINVFEIFLEYALYCWSGVGTEEALYNIRDFGGRLGRSIAEQLQNSALPFLSHNSACQILRDIFETVDTQPWVKNVDDGVRVIITDYPLERAAKHSGLWNVELAHCGINSMCQSLVHCVNPSLALNTSSDARSEFIFTILTPCCAQCISSIRISADELVDLSKQFCWLNLPFSALAIEKTAQHYLQAVFANLWPFADSNLGITDGYKTALADARLESAQGKGAWIRVVMGEGRKRQIREIRRQLELPLVRIVRIRIGTLRLGSLKPR